MYFFKRMPFGLRNAPATFQRLIDKFRSGIGDILLLAYLDDIIVCSATFENHIKDLDSVFQRLERFKLRVNIRKCRFCCQDVKYLGHILSAEGISVDPEQTVAIRERKEPKNVKQLLSFLQTCSWFIENFAEISKPLSSLTKKNAEWRWDSAQQAAFGKLNELLVTAPILSQVDENLPFILKTDASGFAIGAVLLQGREKMSTPLNTQVVCLAPLNAIIQRPSERHLLLCGQSTNSEGISKDLQ